MPCSCSCGTHRCATCGFLPHNEFRQRRTIGKCPTRDLGQAAAQRQLLQRCAPVTKFERDRAHTIGNRERYKAGGSFKNCRNLCHSIALYSFGNYNIRRNGIDVNCSQAALHRFFRSHLVGESSIRHFVADSSIRTCRCECHQQREQ